jgi:hypothetical protein
MLLMKNHRHTGMDLCDELEIGFLKLHEWIRSEVIKSGHGSLDEGHWPVATAPTGGGNRISRFHAASYPVLMGVRVRNRKNSVAVRS